MSNKHTSSVEVTNIEKGCSIVTVYSNLIRSLQVGTEEEGKEQQKFSLVDNKCVQKGLAKVALFSASAAGPEDST